jgi:hypothetical protein
VTRIVMIHTMGVMFKVLPGLGHMRSAKVSSTTVGNGGQQPGTTSMGPY